MSECGRMALLQQDESSPHKCILAKFLLKPPAPVDSSIKALRLEQLRKVLKKSIAVD